jgi:hypothetical protein
MIGVRVPVGAGNFPPHHRVHTGSETHPASYPINNRGSFPGGKVAGLGHIARMEDNAPCKKITFSQPEGRTKLRWLDSVLKELKILTVTVWWRTAQDRDL